MLKKRRDLLLQELKQSNGAIKGAQFAEEFSVSRQVIVKDIAILRAQGEKIIATSNGYMMPEENSLRKRVIACRHKPTNVRDELETIVTYGGRVRDVMVEHSVYGEIKGNLRIQASADIDKFIAKFRDNNSKLLSSLTDGTHLHTIEALNEEVLDLIEEQLYQKDILLRD